MQIFKGGIQSKLALMALLAILGMISVLALGAYEQRALIEQERRDKVRAAVEVASGIITHYGTEVEAGHLTRRRRPRRSRS